VDEQEHTGGAEPGPPPVAGATAPLPAPAEAGQRSGRGATARRVLSSRGAGWVVAAVLAGVVIGLLAGVARPAPTVSVAQAGPARFTIGSAGLPPGATVIGPAGVHRQIVIGPAGVHRQITIGPAGLPPGATVIGPAGVSRQIVIGPAGMPGQIVACPAGLPARAIVIGPPGSGASRQTVLPTGPVRVYLPAARARVSWWYVQQPAGAQFPASWAFPQLLPPSGATVHAQAGGSAGVPVQVVPPGQVRANFRALPPGQRITLPAGLTVVCPGGK